MKNKNVKRKMELEVFLIAEIRLYLFKVQLNKLKQYLDNKFVNTDKYTILVIKYLKKY